MTAKRLSGAPPRVEVAEVTEVTMRGVEGLFEKVVTRFGTGAKIDCPKKYLGKAVYVVIRRDEAPAKDERASLDPLPLGPSGRGAGRNDLRPTPSPVPTPGLAPADAA